MEYPITPNNDHTLKQFFDRFYVIPKDKEFTEEELKFLENNKVYPTSPNVINGKHGCITFRHPKKRFSPDQAEVIRADKELSQRQLAKKYKCSTSIINKIINNKY